MDQCLYKRFHINIKLRKEKLIDQSTTASFHIKAGRERSSVNIGTFQIVQQFLIRKEILFEHWSPEAKSILSKYIYSPVYW